MSGGRQQKAPRARTLFDSEGTRSNAGPRAPRSGPALEAQPRVSPEAAPPPVWPTLAAVPAAALPGMVPARRRALQALGLRTVEDVLRCLPRRHEDRSRIYRLGEIRLPGTYTAVVTVAAASESRPRPGLTLLRARLGDGSGALPAVWFNQSYLRRVLTPGARLLVHGPVTPDRRTGRLGFQAPEVEPLPADAVPPVPPGLLPVYPLASGVGQKTVRTIVAEAVRVYAERIPDTTPAEIRQRLGLPTASTAWRHIHLPPTAAELEAARRAIVFEELFHLQVGLLLRRQERVGAVRGFRNAPAGDLTRRLLAALPYRLTAAQRRVLAEIDADLAGPRPMYRLVQGDVGSGKTVVAAAAMLRTIEGGRQAALLAPTEILAEQHFLSLRRLYGGLCRVELLTGSTPRALRRQLLALLEQGDVDVLVGTHALLQPDVAFRALGLAVADEQHRFGVRQRDGLAAKGSSPDVLVLTATPIPRTLAMTLYGDLDVSVIDELPPGRRPVRTYARGPESRPKVYDFVREQIMHGRQAYVICPLIAEAEASAPQGEAADAREPAAQSPDAHEAASAEAWAAWLAERMPDVRIGLLHGRMPAQAKEGAMAQFSAGEIQCLVATTVVEVGVDVPNATVIVIEDADRFGLAQLHQLRGRVGRGAHASYCVLIAKGAVDRLQVLTRTADGFEIAEEDLRQRGPGEILGTRQHGVPELALADPIHDLRLLQEAREAAATVLAADPALTEPAHAHLAAAVAGLFGRPRG